MHSAPLIAKVSYRSVRDTIIKLDPVKDKNLIRNNRSKGKSTAIKDTVKIKGLKTLPSDTVRKNKNGITTELKYVSTDSSRADNVNKVLYLWGNARVTYDDFELDADFIKVDQKNHIVYASGLPDPKTKKYNNRPIFKQKNDKPLIADSLRFNYVTKKGLIYNAASEQDGNFLSGGTAKRLNDEEVAYSNVLFSTCDLPYPATHFGIVITKGIAEKHTIISGPAYLEIEGVPLPLYLPFGFFPKPDSKSSGFILPTFGEDQQLGFYLKGFGYYLALNDYVDLTTLGNYYTKGSYSITSTARYLKKYKYQGQLTLSFASTKTGLETDPASKDFHINWNHTQDAAAHPGTTFSASVNAGTSSYYQNTRADGAYNLTALTQNQLSSSIAYGKTWPGSLFNFTASVSHNQDISRKVITNLELPSFSLNMTTVSPFDSKDRIGEQKWYQRITVGYSLQGTNKLTNIPEAELFTAATFPKKLQNGFNQSVPVSLSLNVLKYFQFSSSFTYNERDYFQTIRKHYERGSISSDQTLVVDTVQGFRRAGDYSISTGLSTKLYSMVLFKKGRLKAIRQVITPNVSFQYRPDFSDPKYGYYNTIVSNATIPYPYTTSTYSIFEQGVYGYPGSGKSAGLSISLDNTIEAKMAAKSSDTSGKEKIIPLLQGFSLSTFYNFVADSLKLSAISFSGRTALFNQKLGISFGGSLNPYVNRVRDSISNGQIVRYANEINRYTWQDGKFPTLTSFNLSMDISLNSESLKHPDVARQQQVNTLATATKSQRDKLALINSDPNAYVDFNIPWNINVSYSFFYTNTGVTTTTTNTLNFNGDLNITPNWKLQYTSGYDIKAGQISTTSLSIYRNLHCWDLSFQWIPFGYYKFYSVDLKVKASVLQDLKLTKRKDYYNNY
ncbi:putative LPS assembly protein LptD [Mucilaginibacter gracilis]|uniref:putative LPS assembly protein LptD n=1 Tax=Mucilaginibacter gracilis TaxID=423350 RepID=UPI001FE2E1CF|nr:putative LPS assembly protein LptD [Mucilaginibacter gracilis]